MQCNEKCSSCSERCARWDNERKHVHDCGGHGALRRIMAGIPLDKKKKKISYSKSAEQSLYERIRRCLEYQQGMCLDNEAERIAVATQITRLLAGKRTFKPTLREGELESVELFEKDCPYYKLL